MFKCARCNNTFRGYERSEFSKTICEECCADLLKESQNVLMNHFADEERMLIVNVFSRIMAEE